MSHSSTTGVDHLSVQDPAFEAGTLPPLWGANKVANYVRAMFSPPTADHQPPPMRYRFHVIGVAASPRATTHAAIKKEAGGGPVESDALCRFQLLSRGTFEPGEDHDGRKVEDIAAYFAKHVGAIPCFTTVTDWDRGPIRKGRVYSFVVDVFLSKNDGDMRLAEFGFLVRAGREIQRRHWPKELKNLASVVNKRSAAKRKGRKERERAKERDMLSRILLASEDRLTADEAIEQGLAEIEAAHREKAKGILRRAVDLMLDDEEWVEKPVERNGEEVLVLVRPDEASQEEASQEEASQEEASQEEASQEEETGDGKPHLRVA